MGLSEDVIELMTSGDHFVIAGSKKKTCFVRLSGNHRTLIINFKGCRPYKKKKIKLEDIKELQKGHDANYWKQSKKDLPDKKLCFSIVMEKASKKNQNLIAITSKQCEEWTSGLNGLCHLYENLNPDQQQYFWLWKHFEEADKNKDNKLNFKEIYKLLFKISMSLHEDIVKNILKEYDQSGDGHINFHELIEFVQDMSKRNDIKNVFEKFSETEIMTANQLMNFLTNIQKEDVSEKIVKDLISKFNNGSETLDLNSFTKLLLSEWGEPFKQEHLKTLHMDMTQPLSHYFIASSHNTYLSDHQLYGESNISNYQRAIDQGCRCVELDCWDGDDGEPIIYHGHTLTTSIKFVHVIEVIRDYSFQKTDFPMILSLENHCSISQQLRMIQIMKKLLGDKLLTKPISSSEDQLPSPVQLKNKVILKGKISTENTQICKELSDAIIYMKSCHFDGFENAREKYTFKNMSSLKEEKAIDLAEEETNEFIKHNNWQLVRIYPKGTRTASSNYNPIPLWNVGCQIVALNYQSQDECTYINLVNFRRNKGCGFLLKPKHLFDPTFNPNETTAATIDPTKIVVQVLSGQQLPNANDSKDKDIIDPYVKINIEGCSVDKQSEETSHVSNNGYNPQWVEEFLSFHIKYPSLAFMTFIIMDKDSVGNDDEVGRYSIPVDSLASGYRHIYLESFSGEQMSPSSIFVHIKIEKL